LKIGTIIQWPSDTLPDETFLFARGQAVSRTAYAELFSVIGTTYGAGDGSTTFNVPDLRGRVGVGAGTGTDGNGKSVDFTPLGSTFGEYEHTLTIDEMPSHYHSRTDNLYNAERNAYGIYGQVYKSGTSSGLSSSPTDNAGGGQAHNIIQPGLVLNYIIKALNPDSIKISELDSATSVTSSDVLAIVQSGETKKVTVGNLLKETYSTTETLTNKVWIDGKPIYRKVFTGNMLSSSSGQYWDNLFKTNLPIDTLVNIDGMIQNTLTDHRAIKINTIESDDYYCIVSYLQSTDYVQTKVNGWLYTDMGFVYRIVLEYTKTS